MAANNKCRFCGSELKRDSRICPQCRKYQGGGDGKLIVMGIIVFIIVLMIAAKSNNISSDNGEVRKVNSNESSNTIEYTKYDLSQMIKELDDNALRADKKYNDQYIEISGILANVDSSGKYISLEPDKDDLFLDRIMCYIKTDEQTNRVLELNTGDVVTIKGKVVAVGEVLGYRMDIDEIE